VSGFFRQAQRHQRMVCFDDGTDRFQMRAAGIAIRDGRVLVQNITGDSLSTIPGGRIDQGETSVEAVVREIDEEFGERVTLGGLLFVIESFFPEHGVDFHEVGFFYEMTVADSFPYRADGGVCHRFQEGPVELEYRWVATERHVLAAHHVHPVVLHDRLGVLPQTTQHILDRRLAR
jgi:8-oxo-dGTP pyrophosphatase MutT (NUDIX family)